MYHPIRKRMTIHKMQIQEPTAVQIQKSTGWFKKDGAILSTPGGLFTLKDDQSLLESFYHVQVQIDDEIAATTARYISGVAKTKIPITMISRMERVTKKKPPSKLEIQVFMNSQAVDDTPSHSKRAHQIIQSFSPIQGEGRIFIGFRTSQTTGLGAHVCAPFVSSFGKVPVKWRSFIDSHNLSVCCKLFV
jgi:hypothetical protein